MAVEERRPSTGSTLPVDINRCDVEALLSFRSVLLLPDGYEVGEREAELVYRGSHCS